MTEPIKIRPRNQRPLFSLKFNDYVNLDKDFNVTIKFIERRLIKPTVLKGIRWPTVTISNKFFKSNTAYRIKVGVSLLHFEFYSLNVCIVEKQKHKSPTNVKDELYKLITNTNYTCDNNK